MPRFLRRRHLRQHIALVAMLLLLWSQTALAWHALCTHVQQPTPAPQAQAAAMLGHAEHCAEQAPPAPSESSLCAAHCDQGVPSPDIVRIPALLALPALVPTLSAALVPASTAVVLNTDAPPPIPWNRPTPHPAALLLI